MPESLALVHRLRDAGHAAVVSGAGPSVLTFCDAAECPRIRALGPEGWRAEILPVSLGGVEVDGVATFG
jgi:homoserine kinase